MIVQDIGRINAIIHNVYYQNGCTRCTGRISAIIHNETSRMVAHDALVELVL